MPREIRRTIFEPGITTKTGGWGIGLALARRVVEEHTTAGSSSTPWPTPAAFVIRIPLADQEVYAGMDWLDGLNPAQREAVEHVHGPHARARRRRLGEDPRAHHAHRAPDRAARRAARADLRRDVHQQGRRRDAGADRRACSARDPAGLWIGTFHSLSARLLRREAELLGFTPPVHDLRRGRPRGARSRRLLERAGHLAQAVPPARGAVASSPRAKNRLRRRRTSPRRPVRPRSPGRRRRLRRARAARCRRAERDGLRRPLLLLRSRCFREHPDRLAAWRERFRYMLVDEFQDTNQAQYELVARCGGHGNVCVVGDDDQSIYGWRGADVRNMLDFQQDFPGRRLVRLEENYRSTQVVLDAANAVIAENRGRLGKTLRTRAAGRRAGHAARRRRRARRGRVDRARARCAGARRTMSRLRDMAVLYRTNAQSRALEEALPPRAACPTGSSARSASTSGAR